MVGITGINTAGVGSVVPTPISTPSVNAPANSSFAASAGAVSSATNPAPNETSKFVNNPLARVLITQYYDSNDQIISQFPSSTVVAYLENGLTADGLPQQSTSA